MIAAGWYTPIHPQSVEPQAQLVWGIAVIVAFCLGYVARGGGVPLRIRSYFHQPNHSQPPSIHAKPVDERSQEQELQKSVADLCTGLAPQDHVSSSRWN